MTFAFIILFALLLGLALGYLFGARTQREAHRAVLESERRAFQQIVETLKAQMREATDQLLHERQHEFATTSSQTIDRLVTPLRESLTRMETTLHDTQLHAATQGADLRGLIQQMMHAAADTRESTDQLLRVFQHQTQMQGAWGETVLDELLHAQGLTAGVHYDTQATLHGEGTVRPDVILHLDHERDIIIDAKVSLTAFVNYCNATDADTREAALRRHVESLQRHVDELARKDYSSYIRPPHTSMGYVIMFVPHTGALWTAVSARPDLWRRAMERNVYIADEQTLMAALRIINLTWTQIRQAENHEQLYRLADEMVNRVGQFYKTYQRIGPALDTARRAYDDAARKLDDHGQSIIVTARQLTQLGAKRSANNPLPESLD